jgi:hypothetical protein
MLKKTSSVFAFALLAFALSVFAAPLDSAYIPLSSDNNPIKPPFKDEWFSNGGNLIVGSLPDGRSVHSFGPKGKPIPPNMAGELILTAYPNSAGDVAGIPYSEWIESSSLQKFFGLPPEATSENELFGIADPATQTRQGGYVFVKNGFPGESSVSGKIQVAPTRCVSDNSELKPRINCLNFSLLAKQPFQIAVTVYDQYGDFITQYRETINEKEFRNIVQGPNYVKGSGAESIVHSDDCEEPTNANYGAPNVSTINGLVKVNVNIYPFHADGRSFGNGVYILKIAKVDLPYEGCVNSDGTAVKTTQPFVRSHSELKMGWMRTGEKKR